MFIFLCNVLYIIVCPFVLGILLPVLRFTVFDCPFRPSIYGLWLPLSYLQAFPCLARNHKRSFLTSYLPLGTFGISEILAFGNCFTVLRVGSMIHSVHEESITSNHRPAQLADAPLDWCYKQRRHSVLYLYSYIPSGLTYIILYVIKTFI